MDEIINPDNYREILSLNELSRLNKILKYKLSDGILFLLSILNSVFIFLLVIAAIIFAPYMLFVLFKEKRFGWITFFLLLVILPMILLLLFFRHVDNFIFLFLIPLAFYYFYYFLLKMTVAEWVEEKSWKLQ
jgi:Ca2+/Na+ antiporter